MIRLPFGRSVVRSFGRSGGASGGSTGFCGAEAMACSFLYRGKNAELPRSSLVMMSTLSCFFIGMPGLGSSPVGEKDLPDELLVGQGCFGARVERVDVGLVEVGIP